MYASVDPCATVIRPEAVDSLPATMARRYNVVPIAFSGGQLKVAVEDPLDFELVDKLRFYCGMPIEVVIAAPDRIRAAVLTHYGEEAID